MFFSGRKIFCFGHNKIRITSLAAAMKGMGDKAGRQSVAERLFDAWCNRDFGRITKYCKNPECSRWSASRARHADVPVRAHEGIKSC